MRMARFPAIIVRFFDHAHRDDGIEWLLRQR
jgi:hypothetical protein